MAWGAGGGVKNTYSPMNFNAGQAAKALAQERKPIFVRTRRQHVAPRPFTKPPAPRETLV